jgi:hypothetical protein
MDFRENEDEISRQYQDGAWRVARGAWRVARGAWRVARGAWRVARGAWIFGLAFGTGAVNMGAILSKRTHEQPLPDSLCRVVMILPVLTRLSTRSFSVCGLLTIINHSDLMLS